MRALLLTAICAVGIASILQFPFVGIMMWHWLSIMNPHRFAYGFTMDLPIILVTAIVTLVMWFISSEPKRFPVTTLSMLMLAFVIWFTITMLLSASAAAYKKWDESFKVFLMIFATMAMTTTRNRIMALIWVCAVSVGFWGVKGGVFSILNGGQYRIHGPENSFFEDNNQCGLALLMVVPLWLYLVEQARSRIAKISLISLTGLIVTSIILTYSRGALVGLIIVGLAIWITSRRKVTSAILVACAMVIAAPLVPEQWYQRMQTIETYEQDDSANLRLKSWAQGWAMALDRPLTGYGFKSYLDQSVFEKYKGELQLDRPREAHSIYFQIMGEQGFVGLGIFMGIIFFAFLAAGRVFWQTKDNPELFWANRLSRALLLCLTAYFASGAFLSVAYFDLYYFLVTLLICLNRVVAAGEKEPSGRVGLFDWLRWETFRPQPAPVPAPRGSAVG